MFCVFCVPGDAACFGKRREGPSHRYDHLPSPRKVNSCETDQTGVIKVCIINSRVTLILMSPKHKSILPHNTAVPASKTPIPSTMDSGRVTLPPQHPPLATPLPRAALVCSPAPGMMVGTQQRPSTPNRCNAQGIPNTLRVSIASCKEECEYTEREEGGGYKYITQQFWLLHAHPCYFQSPHWHNKERSPLSRSSIKSLDVENSAEMVGEKDSITSML